MIKVETMFDRLSLNTLSNSKNHSRPTDRSITPLRLDSTRRKDPHTDRSYNRSTFEISYKLSVVTLCPEQKYQQISVNKQIEMLCDILNDMWLMLLNKRFILSANFHPYKQLACNTIYELQYFHKQYCSLKEEIAEAIGTYSLYDSELVERCRQIVSCLLALQEQNEKEMNEEPYYGELLDVACQTDSQPSPPEYKNLMSKISILEGYKAQLVATIEHEVNSLKTTINELFKQNGDLMDKLAAAQSYIKEYAISSYWNIKVLYSALERERRVSASINQNIDDPEVYLKILELDARCREYEEHITNLERIILDERQANRYLSDEIENIMKTERVRSPYQHAKSPLSSSNFFCSPEMNLRRSTDMLCQSNEKLFLRNEKIYLFNSDIENIFQQFSLDAGTSNTLLSFTKGLFSYPYHDMLYMMVEKMLENLTKVDDRQLTMKVYLEQMEAVLDECQQPIFHKATPIIGKALAVIEEESPRDMGDSGVHIGIQTENTEEFYNIEAFRSEIREMYDEANAFRRSLYYCLSRPDRTKNLSASILCSLENRL